MYGIGCAAVCQPLVYDDMPGDKKGLAFAKEARICCKCHAGIFKATVRSRCTQSRMPINPAFMTGSSAFNGEGVAYTPQEAIEHLRNAASATTRPFIFLSGGATNQVFCEMLELTAEAHIKFSGVLCGATWQEGPSALFVRMKVW